SIDERAEALALPPRMTADPKDAAGGRTTDSVDSERRSAQMPDVADETADAEATTGEGSTAGAELTAPNLDHDPPKDVPYTAEEPSVQACGAAPIEGLNLDVGVNPQIAEPETRRRQALLLLAFADLSAEPDAAVPDGVILPVQLM